ncbi:hypothetical protein ABZ362_19920 [Streptomyces sp. NPDC005951]|uniref:hypothetical protein n=1 Tax=Streptomyces sp. NPDC005951 TaxID=3154573 RepID=UPI0033CB1223
MADGTGQEQHDRRDSALAEARQALAAVKGHLCSQGPDAGAALGSLIADCHALLARSSSSGIRWLGVGSRASTRRPCTSRS